MRPRMPPWRRPRRRAPRPPRRAMRSARPKPTSATRRADRFVSPGGLIHDSRKTTGLRRFRSTNGRLTGAWQDGRQSAPSLAPGAKISFRFHARDLHLVLGPGTAGSRCVSGSRSTARRRAATPGWTLSGGMGPVKEQRLYQLVRQKGPVRDRTFTIEFLDPGVEAFSFTFG